MSRLTRRLYRAMSSPELLIWAVLGWVLYYVTLATWGDEAFGRFIGSLGRNAVLTMLYALSLLIALLNIVRSVSAGIPGRGLLRTALRAVLPVGVLLFLTGFFLSASFRTMELRTVAEGHTFRPQWEDGAPLVVGKIDPALKSTTLGAESGGTVFEYEPSLVLSSAGRDYRVGAFPPTRIGRTYYHILNFGLAPGMKLKMGGLVLNEGYVPVRILPPGVSDEFDIRPFPYRFIISIAPERVVQRGDKTVKYYNLRSPRFNLSVMKGEELLFEGNSDDLITFDGLSLSFMEPTPWVMLDMARDRGVPLLIAGLAVSLAGLLLVPAGLLIPRRKGHG